MDRETLSRKEVLAIFAPVQTRPSRGSYTGYGKRLPSDRPPIMTPKELALTAAAEVNEYPAAGNGQASPWTPGVQPLEQPLGMPPRSHDDDTDGGGL